MIKYWEIRVKKEIKEFNINELKVDGVKFGVKFVVIYNLQRYVDKVCQRYLHHFIYFENFVIFENYFMILSLFYLISRSFYIILYMDLRPWEAILTGEEFCCISIG